jgi:rhodanese-related sulfurtransferase
MRTSDPDIYAGGDCVEVKNLVTGQPMYLPLGSMANRQGRIIGDNLAGGSSRFAGVVGSWCVKLFDLGAAGTGLTLAGAKRAGFDAVAAHITAVDRAHFYPEHGIMSLELVAERGTRRVLGLQGISDMGDALVGKVNTVAAMLPNTPTVTDISNVEVAYSPPFASAMDILNTVGNIADNILTGQNKGISVTDFAKIWEDAGNDAHIIDCRENLQGVPLEEKYPGRWHNIPQGQLRHRLAEVPKDKPVVLMCNTGARSYEALVTLTDAGFTQVVSVEGGMAAVKAVGIDV